MIGGTIGGSPIAYTEGSSLEGGSGSFIFDGFDISNCGELSIDTANYDDMNRISLDTYDSPRTDGGGVLGYFVRGKILNIKLVIMEDTEEDLNDMIDTLKLKLFKKEGILKIRVNGVYREAKCSLTSINFNRDFEKKTILPNVTMSFTTMENFHDENSTSYTEVGVSTPTFPLDISNLGSRVDYIFYIIFGSGIVGTSNISVAQDGYTLSIAETISDGDILIIDGVRKRVTLNNVAIDYDGPFVQLQNGSNPIVLSIDGTYIADITYLYYRNYL